MGRWSSVGRGAGLWRLRHRPGGAAAGGRAVGTQRRTRRCQPARRPARSSTRPRCGPDGVAGGAARGGARETRSARRCARAATTASPTARWRPSPPGSPARRLGRRQRGAGRGRAARRLSGHGPTAAAFRLDAAADDVWREALADIAGQPHRHTVTRCTCRRTTSRWWCSAAWRRSWSRSRAASGPASPAGCAARWRPATSTRAST